MIVTVVEELINTAFLYLLGLLGWWIGQKLHLPAPFVLGGIFLIGGLRILGVDLPYVSDVVIIVVQIILGVMVGAQFDREAFKALGTYMKPAALVAAWALTIALLLGYVISLITPLHITTAVLGSSIGGLPEMTVLAHETGADSVTVVLFHIVRVLATMFTIPILIQQVIKPASGKRPAGGFASNAGRGAIFKNKSGTFSLGRLAVTLALAGMFGGLLMYAGVPAGGLVGGLIFVMAASYFELPIQVPPASSLDYFLVGIGLMVSNEVEPETLRLIFSEEIALALLLSLIFTFGSSFLVAYCVYKMTGWEFLACFLSAAPAGFTVMIGYAIREGYDPVPVSLLQLSRLVTLKLAIPFIFMIFY